MITLLAYAPEDGWAFVREGERIFLVRPPYVGNRLSARQQDVERAVTVTGYRPYERNFRSDRELLEFLRDEVVRSWPVKESPEQLRQELLRLASPDEIDVYLDEADDWQKQGRHEEASALLRQLYCAKAITFEQRVRLAARLDEQSLQERHREDARKTTKREILQARFTRAGSLNIVGPRHLQPVG